MKITVNFFLLCAMIFMNGRAVAADASFQCLQWSASAVAGGISTAETLNLTEWHTGSSPYHPDIYGVAVCATTVGNSVGDVVEVGRIDVNYYDISGLNYCWCRQMTGIGEYYNNNNYVFAQSFDGRSPCYLNCAAACVRQIKSGGTFNQRLFN